MVERRLVLRHSLCLGIGLSLAPTLTLGQEDPSSLRPREGDLLVKVGDTTSPLRPSDIPREAPPIVAWALDPSTRTVRSGSRLNRVLLITLDMTAASAETRSRAAENVVAYTAICTHSGCEVVDWLADEHLLYCACHSSKFDPNDGARVVEGPAPRSLPALPLKVTEGLLVVAQPFTDRVGFESA
jgi:Rieske Fe-S protein